MKKLILCNKKFRIFLASIILIVAVIVILYLSFFNNCNYKFKLNSKNKYKIETDMKWITMQNDGGSYTNVYYNIDLDSNIISKFKENHKVNIGGKSKDTISKIYEKEISVNQKKELKGLLEELMKNSDINEAESYNYFIIFNLNNEKTIYNQDMIERIKNILEMIDKS